MDEKEDEEAVQKMDDTDLFGDFENENKDEDAMSEVDTLTLLKQKIEGLEARSTLIQQLKSAQVDIAEVYSPPRVTRVAERFGLKSGEAMDLLTGWDFSMSRHREAARAYVRRVKPRLIIGSPECTMFSTLQNLSCKPWSSERQQKLSDAIKHVEFAVELYEMQAKEGRWFLHEHPASAGSWNLEAMRKMARRAGVRVVVADQCQYGLKTHGSDPKIQDRRARKRTKCMTNSDELAIELSRRCAGGHKHQPLTGGRAREAAQYPKPLCEAICRGMKKELRKSQAKVASLGFVTGGRDVNPRPLNGLGEPVAQILATEQSLGRSHSLDEEEDDQHLREAWDDVSGASLPVKEVMKARRKELEYISEKSVWMLIDREAAKRKRIKIVGSRWLDVNKGDAKNPVFRSRFVAKEFNHGKADSLFASTPPLEALRWLISDAATVAAGKSEDKVMMLSDVARAFFEADATRTICVELPPEVKSQPGNEGKVALLKKSLYGTRDAALNFQREVGRFMTSIGFRRGRYNTCTYWHALKKLKVVIHGDDFITVGERARVSWFKDQPKKRFEVKNKILGNAPNDLKEETILNRIARVSSGGWEYEADPRHAQILVKAMNMEDAKAAATAGEDEKKWEEDEDAQELQEGQATEYRQLAARANYLAADRADVQYAVKQLCRGMARPTQGHKKKLRRLATYLAGVPRVVVSYPWQEYEEEIWGYSDSDWAGCKKTAKSTSGGVLMRGQHFIKSWSTTQKAISWSSAEAELIAAVKPAVSSSVQRKWWLTGMSEISARLLVDSSAAIGIMQRQGNGKMRHVKSRHPLDSAER